MGVASGWNKVNTLTLTKMASLPSQAFRELFSYRVSGSRAR